MSTAPLPDPTEEPEEYYLNPATKVVHLDAKCPGYARALYGTRINYLPPEAGYTVCTDCAMDVVDHLIESTRPSL